jgi:hypothetical protein
MNYSFIESGKGQSERPKCKTVPPQGASHDPGMDIRRVKSPSIARQDTMAFCRWRSAALSRSLKI